MYSSRLANKRKGGGRYVNGAGGRYYNNNTKNSKYDVGYYNYKQFSHQDDVVSVSSVKSSLRGGDEEFHVDKAADEFIEKFYRELMMQKWNMAREPTATAVRFG